MTENRTQAPSKHRRQQARERGQAAHSPELTGAIGLLAASAALWVWGDGLALAVVTLVREPVAGVALVSTDASEVVARLRQVAFEVFTPIFLVMFAFTAAALGAHQVQVGGVWAPGLLAPDPSRLWAFGSGSGFGYRASRGLWGMAKAVVVLAISASVIRIDWPSFQRLEDANALAVASAQGVRHLLIVLSAATVVLGLIDYWLRHRRFEAMLSTTPEEQREDLRAMEGDPALRARRRRIARSWRTDSPELIAGASLVLTGPRGLTVLLAGGPPPRIVSVRSIVSGLGGDRLRRAADSAGVTTVSAPGLALRFAKRRSPSLPPTPDLLHDLAPLWPDGKREV